MCACTSTLCKRGVYTVSRAWQRVELERCGVDTAGGCVRGVGANHEVLRAVGTAAAAAAFTRLFRAASHHRTRANGAHACTFTSAQFELVLTPELERRTVSNS